MKAIMIGLKLIFITCVIGAAALSGEFRTAFHGPTLAVILLGGVGMILMSFSPREIGAAFGHALNGKNDRDGLRISLYFWETTARNMLMMGGLGTVMGFAIMMNNIRSIGSFGVNTSTAILALLYGVILAALSAVPALVVKKKLDALPAEETRETTDTPAPKIHLENVPGYLLFIGVIIAAVADGFQVFLHWPSILVVAGWALALILLMGDAASGHSITLSFAFTGLIGVFIGFVRLIHAIGNASIKDVAAGMTFSILSCVFAMLGMILAGLPMEDRAFKREKNGKGMMLSRFAWYGFPLLALSLILFSFLLAIIPMGKH